MKEMSKKNELFFLHIFYTNTGGFITTDIFLFGLFICSFVHQMCVGFISYIIVICKYFACAWLVTHLKTLWYLLGSVWFYLFHRLIIVFGVCMCVCVYVFRVFLFFSYQNWQNNRDIMQMKQNQRKFQQKFFCSVAIWNRSDFAFDKWNMCACVSVVLYGMMWWRP